MTRFWIRNKICMNRPYATPYQYPDRFHTGHLFCKTGAIFGPAPCKHLDQYCFHASCKHTIPVLCEQGNLSARCLKSRERKVRIHAHSARTWRESPFFLFLSAPSTKVSAGTCKTNCTDHVGQFSFSSFS